jgi:hypothetical protein
MSRTIQSRYATINAVKTPLAFLVLGLLIVEGTVAGLAVSLIEYRGLLVWTAVVSVPAYALVVVFLSVWRPEALLGVRPLQAIYANQFAADLFLALDGSLRNLEKLERAEAWITVADVITNYSEADRTYATFCSAVAARLKTLANVTSRGLSTPGPMTA